MSTSFVTSFKRNLKLVEYFKSCGESEKYFKNSGMSTSFVTVFKSILELVELFASCGESEKNV